MIKWSAFPLLSVLVFGILESVILGYSYFIIFCCILFFTVSLDIISFHLLTARRLRSVLVRRKIVTARTAGNFDVDLRFTNQSAGLLYFRYADMLTDDFLPEGDYSGHILFRGRGELIKSYSIYSPFFGRHSLGPLILTASDAFGLCSFAHTVADVDHVSVSPVIAESAGMRGEPIRKTLSAVGANTMPRSGQGYQFLSLRPYTIHDDSRMIAWGRFGLLDGEDVYVKEMEDERTTDTIFIIDFSSSTNIGKRDRIYCSEISSALRVAFGVCKQGDRIGYFLHSSTRSFFIPPSTAAVSGRKLQHVLKSTEPDGTFSVPSAIRELGRSHPKTALTIMISPLLAGITAGPGDVPLQSLSRGSFRMVVPDASTYFDKSDRETKSVLMRMLMAERKSQCIAAVKSLNSLGIRTQISSSRTLLTDLSRIWLEGRYSHAGF